MSRIRDWVFAKKHEFAKHKKLQMNSYHSYFFIQKEEEPKYENIENDIDELRVRVQTLSKVMAKIGEGAKTH